MCYNKIIQLIRTIVLWKNMMMKSRFLEAKKAIETILYISQKTNDLFHIVKIHFYADKYHLEKYGRLITGDRYIAMEDGPVPSGAYDLIKYVRGDQYRFDKEIVNAHPERAFFAKDNIVEPKREPDIDYLSISDRECLDLAINKFAKMDGKDLWGIVHNEESYKKTSINEPIRMDILVKSLPNGQEVLDYLEN